MPKRALATLTAAWFLLLIAAATYAQTIQYDVGSAVDKRSGRLITFTVIDGYAVWGDIGLGKVADIERDGLYLPQGLSDQSASSARNSVSPKDAFATGARLWSLPIPYDVSDSRLSSSVAAAIAQLEQRTFLRFVRRTTQPVYFVPVYAGYVGFAPVKPLVARVALNGSEPQGRGARRESSSMKSCMHLVFCMNKVARIATTTSS
jgi:hypothetical protein